MVRRRDKSTNDSLNGLVPLQELDPIAIRSSGVFKGRSREWQDYFLLSKLINVDRTHHGEYHAIKSRYEPGRVLVDFSPMLPIMY